MANRDVTIHQFTLTLIMGRVFTEDEMANAAEHIRKAVRDYDKQNEGLIDAPDYSVIDLLVASAGGLTVTLKTDAR